MYSIKKTNLSSKVYIFFPFLFILFPIFPKFLPGNLGIQVLFAMELILLIVCGLIGIYKVHFSYIAFFIFSFFVLMTIFSILYDLFRNVLILSDLYELTKPLAFLLFYTFYRKAGLDITILEKNTLRSLLIVFYMLSVYCILEFFLPDTVRPWSYLLYKKEYVPILKGMAIGSFEITYNFAFVLLFPLIYSILSLILYFNIKSFLSFFLLFFAFLLTQSRSMYITLACSLFIILCLPLLYSQFKTAMRIIMIVSLLIIIGVSIYVKYYDSLKIVFGYAITGLETIAAGSNGSVNNRENQIQWAIENNHFILIGSGIGKGLRMLESFYSLYYYRYGLTGVFLYLTIPIVTALTAYRIAKKEYKYHKEISPFYLSLYVYFIVTPVGILSATNQDTPKTAFIFYGLMGLVFHKYAAIKNRGKYTSKL